MFQPGNIQWPKQVSEMTNIVQKQVSEMTNIVQYLGNENLCLYAFTLQNSTSKHFSF
jgi:hypothetical protein